MNSSRFDQLRISTTIADAGLEPYADGTHGPSAIRVATSTGLTRAALGVALDTSSSVTFQAGVAWEFPNGVTAEGLFVVGAPVDATHVVNKGYVDTATESLQWRQPVLVDALVGNASVATINGLTPTLGDSYVTLSAGTPTAGTSDALGIGDITEYDGTSWKLITAASGGFVPVGSRVILSLVTALIAPYTAAADDGKIFAFSGASNTATDTGEATDGSAVIVRGGGVSANAALLYDGAVPSGTWIQFSGGAVSAGDGLLFTGSVLNAVAGDTSITMNADDFVVNLDATDGAIILDGANGLAFNPEAAGAGTGGLTIVSNAVRVDIETAGAGTGGLVLVAGGLAVAVGDGVELTASGVAVLLEAAGAGTGGLAFDAGELRVDAGDGIVLDASGVAVSPDTTGVATITVGANGVSIATTAAGAGLLGGGTAALDVGAGTGITVNVNDVAIDIASTVTFDAAVAWTFPNGVTAKGLFVTGTPVDVNHAVNKNYVDNNSAGLAWLEPVVCIDLIGNASVATLNGFSPLEGDGYVMTDAGTLTTGSLGVLAGDIVEYDGAAWTKIVTNSGGFPPNGTRMILKANGTTLIAPYSDPGDRAKVVEYDGTSLTGVLTTPSQNDAVLVVGNPGDTQPVDDNRAYVNDGGAGALASWIQFSGGGTTNAGTGLSLAGNTINANAADGSINMNANDFAVNLEAAGAGAGGIELVAGGLAVQADATSTGTTASVLDLNANGVALRIDDASLEGSAAGGLLRVKDSGIVEAKLGISFREETFTAASFALSSGNYVVTLANTALATVKTYRFNECSRNGLADMTNTNAVDPTIATEYRVTATELQIGADITATGDVFRVRYLSSDVV